MNPKCYLRKNECKFGDENPAANDRLRDSRCLFEQTKERSRMRACVSACSWESKNIGEKKFSERARESERDLYTFEEEFACTVVVKERKKEMLRKKEEKISKKRNH